MSEIVENPTVRDMVKAALIARGYDGVHSQGGDCGCSIDDLGACCELSEHCIAGYRCPCDCGDHHDYHIGSKKPEPEAGQIWKRPYATKTRTVQRVSIRYVWAPCDDGIAREYFPRFTRREFMRDFNYVGRTLEG